MIPMVQEIMSLQESPRGMTQAKTIVKPLFCTFGHSMPQKEKFFFKKTYRKSKTRRVRWNILTSPSTFFFPVARRVGCCWKRSELKHIVN